MLKGVGEAAAQRDIDECTALANRAGASSGGSQAMKSGAEGAAIGAATAAVGSLIRGGNVGEGAAAGTVSGAFRSGEGSPVFRNFVQRCLAERGYDVIGWKWGRVAVGCINGLFGSDRSQSAKPASSNQKSSG